MKKFYSFLVAAVVLMVATSCQKEAVENGFVGENAEFTASIASGRTELGGTSGRKVMWNANDNIRIYTQANAAGTVFNGDATAATATAKFTTTENFATSENGYLAVYPENVGVEWNTSTWAYDHIATTASYADGVWSIPVGMKSEFFVDKGDVLTAGSFYEGNAFMVAYSQNNTLSFKAATAFLKFTYTGTEGWPIVVFNGGCLTGNATMKYNTADGSISYEGADGTQIALDGLQTGGVYYVPIYPGTVSGITIMEGMQTLITISKELTFQAGVIYDLDMPANMSPWKMMDSQGAGEPIQMGKAGDYHVATNVTATVNGWVFSKDGDSAVGTALDAAMSTWTMTASGWENPIMIPDGETVDVYLNEDATMYYLAPAGTELANIPAIEYAPYSLYDDWTDATTKMFIVGDYYVAPNVAGSDNYTIVDANGDKWGLAADWAENGLWYKTGAFDGTKYKYISVASSMYMPASVYITKDGQWFGVATQYQPLPDVPTVSSKYGIAGSHNDWNPNPDATTPMYEVPSAWGAYDDYYVAYGVEGGTLLKFIDKTRVDDLWDGAIGDAGTVVEGWNYTGSENVSVPTDVAMYDIYLKKDGCMFIALPAGSTYIEDPLYEEVSITAYNRSGWADDAVNVYAFSGLSKIAGVWPGVQMTASAENVLNATLNVLVNDKPAKMQFIFNSVSGQTSDSAEYDYASSYTFYFTASTVLDSEPVANKVKENCLYLKPNSNWVQAGARFAACFCNGTKGATWVDMTKVGANGYYEVEVPGTTTEYKHVIFCRMNPGTTENNWGARWNQSGDLTWNLTKNACAINDGQWDCGQNVTWSTITEY